MLNIINHLGNANQNNKILLHILLGWLKFKAKREVLVGLWRNCNLYTLLAGMKKWHSHFRKQCDQVPQTAKHRVARWPSNSTLRYRAKEIEIVCYTKICTQVFLAAFFIITTKCKQPKCSSADELANKIVKAPQSGILFPCKKERIPDLRYMMSLENMVRQRSQTHNATNCMIPFM